MNSAGLEVNGRSRGIPPHLVPILVLTIGLLASVLAAWQVDRLSRAKDLQRFQNGVERAHSAISDRLQAYISVLRATAGFLAASEGEVTRDEFRTYAERLQLPRIYPGIQGIGFSAPLPGLDTPATRARLATLGAPDVSVRPRTPRPEVHAIVHLEPLDARNRAALGFDMYAEPTRRTAMSRARDQARSAMSGKVELVQEIDAQKQAGFLIYHPVYRGGAPPPSVEARRTGLIGFAYSAFRADDLLAGILGREAAPPIHIAVYDQAVRPENLLHKSFPGPVDAMAREARLSATHRLETAGRTWQVVYYAGPGFERERTRGLGMAFFLGGAVASLLVATASWWQLRARLAAEAEVAARRRSEEQRLLLVAELNHRVKNSLATVQSIAAQTLREGRDIRETRARFEARLLALSEAHNLLTREHWEGAELGELVKLELAPLGAVRDRVTVGGPQVVLPPETALSLAMAVHELATNALKYGALSDWQGRVTIAWRTYEAAGAPRLELEWVEHGGPPVSPPQQRGFGSRLIETGLRRQLQGQVELLFQPEGVCCRIDLPLPETRGA